MKYVSMENCKCPNTFVYCL